MFVRYLEAYLKRSDEEAEKKLATSNDPRKIYHDFIERAKIEGASGYLSRVFNEFPLQYGIFTPIDSAVIASWTTQFDRAIQAIDVNEEGEFKIKNGIEQNAIEAWVKDFIQYACNEILDDDGKLKPKIFELLNLDNLVKEWKKNKPEKIAKIEEQIICSYINSIVIFSFCNIHALTTGLLFSYIQKLLEIHLTKEIEQFVVNQPTLNFCIAKLTKTPESELHNQIKNISTERAAISIPPIGASAPQLWASSVELWIDVMDHFRRAKNLTVTHAIYTMISTELKDSLDYEIVSGDSTYQISPEASNKYMECVDAFNPDPPVLVVPEASNADNGDSSLGSIFRYFGLYATTRCAVEANKKTMAAEPPPQTPVPTAG